MFLNFCLDLNRYFKTSKKEKEKPKTRTAGVVAFGLLETVYEDRCVNKFIYTKIELSVGVQKFALSRFKDLDRY